MAEFKTPQSEADFHKNFEQIKPLMNDTMAYYESARCLFCYDAPCVNACPTGIDIPLFIKQIHTKNVEGAAKTIYTSNALGNTCGKVCPTEVLCEGACVYNEQDIKPIEIGRLQNYATQQAIVHDKKLFRLAPSNGKKVAIIGAGPAGISCACELSLLGYQAVVFEAKDKPSGLVVHGTAPYKITNEEALAEMTYLQKQFGFEIKYNHLIASKDALTQLESGYDAIFMGIGLGNTNIPDLPGKDLDNCFGATEFIEQLKMNHTTTTVGKKVVVLGGGNTAMDAASESARMGAEQVTLAYRRSKEAMGAYAFEYELAKEAGVKGMFGISPVKISGNGKVNEVTFVKMTNENGQLKPIEGSEFNEPCDMLIFATGQAKQVAFLNQIDGLELDAKGRIKVNPETYQSTHPKYFAGGDAVNGGREVVNAVYEGRMAARGIDKMVKA